MLNGGMSNPAMNPNVESGIFVEVIDLDKKLAQLSLEPVIANDLDQTTKEGQIRLNQLLYTKYEGDSLNDIPRCGCGKLEGGQKLGMVCTNCMSEVDFDINRSFESVLWIRAPDGVKAFINPAVWITMSRVMTISKCNALEWLVNPYYKMEPGKQWSDAVKKMIDLGIKRGLNNFHDNFDFIMDTYFNLFPNRRRSIYEVELEAYLKQNRDSIFSKHLPMLSKVGFVVEENDSGVFGDDVMPLAIDALRIITSIDRSFNTKSLTVREHRAVQCIMRMSEFYTKFVKEHLSRKPGAWRKHVLGGRVHWSGRAVISSLSKVHNYEELHVPWSFACQIFSMHLTNKLLKKGWTPLQIKRHITQHTLVYCPLLDKLFKEIIADSPYIGYPCTFGRNPTLARAAIQRLYITKVKTDVRINSISLSLIHI